MKLDNFIRETAENFRFDVKDGWGNENSMIMQGLGILGRKRDNENARSLFTSPPSFDVLQSTNRALVK